MSPETSVLDTEENTNASLLNKVEMNSRVAEFHALLAQNAGVMVESDRAPGYKAPFGVLMGMCAAEITEENVEMFFAEAYAMLARAATETVEKEEKETEENDIREETENKSEQKMEEEREKKSDNAQSRETISSKQDSPVIKRPQTQEIPKQEVTSASSPQTKTESIDNNVSESNGSAVSRVEEAPSKPAQEIKMSKEAVETPIFWIARTETATGSIVVEGPSLSLSTPSKPAVVETMPAKESSSNEPGIIGLEIDKEYEKQKPESKTNYVEIETDEEQPEASQLTQALPDDELLWETSEDLFALKMLELQANEDLALPQVNPHQQFEQSDYSQEGPEFIYDFTVPVEETEQTILLIAERIEAMEAEEAETSHQILNKIDQKIAEAQTIVENGLENQEIRTQSTELEQELTELFIQLFDYVGIKYTPDLLDSCVKLALIGDVEELIGKIDQENEIQTPQDKGMHEVIKHLLSVISTIKKAALYAYQIGKSALSLCSQQLRIAVA